MHGASSAVPSAVGEWPAQLDRFRMTTCSNCLWPCFWRAAHTNFRPEPASVLCVGHAQTHATCGWCVPSRPPSGALRVGRYDQVMCTVGEPQARHEGGGAACVDVEQAGGRAA